MNSTLRISLNLLCLSFAFISCSRTNNSPSTTGGTLVPAPSNLYIAGNIHDTATIWVNGVQKRLPLTMGVVSLAHSIYVAGNDIYVAGAEDWDKPVLWKNGQEIRLADSGVARSVFVYNGDVYVCGEHKSNPVYWKNGVEHILPVGRGLDSAGVAYAITVSGNDVHVAGLVYSIGKGVAAYWKNGALTKLEADSIYSSASGIYVSGTDVYIAGMVSHSGNRATYWKNGVSTKLGIASSGANSIFVSGNDVYVFGEELDTSIFPYKVTCWKNGVPKRYGYGSLGGSANSIFVSGNDVYMGGMTSPDQTEFFSEATLWKNDTAFVIGPEVVNSSNAIFESTANCIFVK